MYIRGNIFVWFHYLLLATLVKADEDYVQDDVVNKQLVRIETLADNCKLDDAGHLRLCNDFQFDIENEVAFFELQTEVRIAADGATYEMGTGTGLDALIFTNSTFVNFPLHLFYSMELRELDMRNCSMRHVTWESFLMANQLVILLLSENELIELGENTFNYASELQFLFLSRNKLSELHRKSFTGLKKLQHLDLSGNRLTELPEGIFDDLEMLQQIGLAENQISIIGNELFARNPRLLTVTLNTNRLRELGEYAFRVRARERLLAVDLSHNQQLNVLLLNLNTEHLWARNCSLDRVNLYGSVTNVDLSDNQLTELYLTAPEAVERLVLRNNSLGQLASLTRVTRLRHLDVSDNPQLGELPQGWQTPALEHLDISNTGQFDFPGKALEGMPLLRKLNISANNISEIEAIFFTQLSNLTHFYLHANKWNCFNLDMIMNMLIRPNGITFTPDEYDSNFPGEYISGVACMYRQPEREQVDSSDSESSSSASVEYVSLESSQKLINFQQSEIDKLRQELKSVVQHFETKFDLVFQQLNELNNKMEFIEKLNRTMWNQVTITV